MARRKPTANVNIDLDASPDINTLFNNLLNGVSKEFPELKQFDMPLVLSFKVKIENGNAIIENVSATPAASRPQCGAASASPAMPPKRSPEREPLVDVSENERKATMMVELAGAEKGDITVTAGATSIRVHAITTHGVYDREVQLRHNIDPKAGEAHYNNGVLEITVPVCADEQSETLIKVS